jgi:DNA-binding winged helix-turn-helix (wHTH) protein
VSLEKVPIFLGKCFVAKRAGDNIRIFRFDAYVLDPVERQLRRDSELIPLTPKAFDTLEFLLRNAGHLVTKDELLAAVWPNSFVDEGNLPRTVHTLRRALNDLENVHRFIETVPTKGYRFIADVQVSVEPAGETGQDTGPMPSEATRPTPLIGNTESRLSFRNDPKRRSGKTRAWIAAATLIVAAGAVGWIEKSGSSGHTHDSAAKQTLNGKAYEHFQLGKFYIERRLPGDEKLALENFDSAIGLDPLYAAAYAGRADARIWMFWSPSASHDNISIARTAVNKALELDDKSSYAHTLSCRIKATYDWDFAGAEKECRRAVELDPDDPDARRELAMLLNSVGRQDDALAEMEQALTIAPTSFNKRSRGLILYFSRHYDEAIEQLKQVEETDPEFEQCTLLLQRAYEMKKDWPASLEYYLRLIRKKAMPAELASVRARFEAGGWTTVLQDMKVRMGSNAYQNAGTLAQLGELDAAFEALDAAASSRRVMIVQAVREPRFDPLKSDPRWTQFMKRIGLE